MITLSIREYGLFIPFQIEELAGIGRSISLRLRCDGRATVIHVELKEESCIESWDYRFEEAIIWNGG